MFLYNRCRFRFHLTSDAKEAASISKWTGNHVLLDIYLTWGEKNKTHKGWLFLFFFF